MRFREYESTPTSGTPNTASRQARCEYRLSSGAALSNSEGRDGDGGATSWDGPLVWSTTTTPKNSSPGDDGTTSITSRTTTTDDANTPKPPPPEGIAKSSPSSSSSSLELKIVVRRTLTKIRQLCRDLFLPIGHPASVAEGYLEYQFYDSLQGLCSYLRGVVSTSAVLSATGVGDAEATALSAAMTWAVRDGLGMIGGLLFSYVASPHFDAHVKEFRLLADVLNDVGLTLDMALPLVLKNWASSTPTSTLFGSWYSAISSYLPSAYLVLTSISTLCKVSCGVAAGATKGNITDHFAISGNRADCQSKESTQETLVSLVGMCCGVWLANIFHRLEKVGGDDTCANVGETTDISDSACGNMDAKPMMDAQIVSWTVFIILTLIHVWANYVGMQMLRLRTLNRGRAKVALESLVEDCSLWILEKRFNCGHFEDNADGISSQKTRAPNNESIASKRRVVENASSHVLSPKAVSESLWKAMYRMVCPGKIRLSVCLKDLVQLSSSYKQHSERKWTYGQWSAENYMIFVGSYCGKTSNHDRIIVMLRTAANDRDELKAFLHSHVLEKCMQHESNYESAKLPQLILRSYEIIQCLFQPSSGSNFEKPGQSHVGDTDLFNIIEEQGWDMKRLYLGFGPWRCEWEDDED